MHYVNENVINVHEKYYIYFLYDLFFRLFGEM